MMNLGTGAKLREEDLIPGKAFVHPETKLEYEDFHAFLCGKDPLPHWRNARIKELHRGKGSWEVIGGIHPGETFDEFLARRYAYFCDNFSVYGNDRNVVFPAATIPC